MDPYRRRRAARARRSISLLCSARFGQKGGRAPSAPGQRLKPVFGLGWRLGWRLLGAPARPPLLAADPIPTSTIWFCTPDCPACLSRIHSQQSGL